MTVTSAKQYPELFAAFMGDVCDDSSLGNDTSIPAFSLAEDAFRWLTVTPWEHVYLASLEGEPFSVVVFHSPEITDTTEPYTFHHELDIYVHPDYRYRHLGAEAVRATVQAIGLGPQEMLLAEIWVWNEPSRRMVEREGWQFVGEFLWKEGDEEGTCARYEISVEQLFTAVLA